MISEVDIIWNSSLSVDSLLIKERHMQLCLSALTTVISLIVFICAITYMYELSGGSRLQ